MSSKKKNKIKKKIHELEKSRQKIVEEMLNFDELLRGSAATVYTKCGRDNCWCKDGKGHSHTRITWTEKSKGYTRKLPEKELPWIKQVTDNYRKFQSLRRKLKKLENQAKELQNKFADVLISDTRKTKDYLWTKK
ncbi:MAG: DUF6788 family protein [Alphaproteobacteria bacterium]